MFSGKNGSGEIETIVGPSVSLRGKLKSDGNIRVQGKVSGEIKTRGDVFIDNEAQVKASVSAKNIVVSGEITGDVESSGEITISETGKVVGNINAVALIIKMGAIFIGKSSMALDTHKETRNKKEKKKEIEPEPELE
jgi:cytoskeletal protein CcmA (bactofilin family)